MNFVFERIIKYSGYIRDLFQIPNTIKEVWVDKVGIDPRNELSSWAPVVEIIFQGVFHRAFLDWSLTALPIGSDFQFETSDAIIHIDVKTHREGDADLDRTQDVRPEQISNCGDYKLYFNNLLPKEDIYIEDLKGVLGDTPPKLPPYYIYNSRDFKICISLFVICVYEINIEKQERFLTRIQLFCVPNGIIRYFYNYKDIFQAGKDGRNSHRYRINLRNLLNHEEWRWKEYKFNSSSTKN